MHPTYRIATLLLAATPVLVNPVAHGANALDQIRVHQGTVRQSTAYQCTDGVVPDPGYTVTVEQTTAIPDSVPADSSIPVVVDALAFTFDDAGSAALRGTGATAVSGSSTNYEFGYGADQGVLSIGESSATVDEQQLPSSGPVVFRASGKSGNAPATGASATLYAPSQFDLSLTLTGGSGGTRAMTCATNNAPVLATVTITPRSSSSLRTLFGLGALVVVVVVVVVGLVIVRRTRRRAG